MTDSAKKTKDFFKKRGLDDAEKFLREKYGSEILMTDEEERKIQKNKTGLLKFDRLLSGGIPQGRIIELFGPPSSGKTTLAMHIISKFQQMDKQNLALYLDYEHSVDLEYAQTLGVSLDKNVWKFCQPSSLEEGVDVLGVLAYTGKIGIAVVDSVAAMTPQEELEGSMHKSTIGAQARGLGKAFRKLVGILKKTNTTCIFINQVRQKIGIVFGNPETTPGGDALKFYSSVRIRVNSKKSKLYDDGLEVVLRLVKNKTGIHNQGFTSYQLVPGDGFKFSIELIDMALEKNIIKEVGRSYVFNDKKIAKGKFVTMVDQNQKLRNSIVRRLNAKGK